MSPTRPALGGRLSVALVAIGFAVAIAACGALTEPAPAPTPADFQGIASEIVKRGIAIDNLVSGDAGCDDKVLNPTAIGLDASGKDQDEPVRLYLYISGTARPGGSLGDRRVRAEIRHGPGDLRIDRSSPFVLAGQGPWAPGSSDSLREALTVASGTGD